MRRYLSPCFSLYLETLKILVAGLCEYTHPPASLYIGRILVAGLCEDTQYREARKILVAGLCEETHPLLLSI